MKYRLSDNFLFKNLKKEETDAIVDRLAEPISFKRGEEIFGKVNSNHAMGVLLCGKAVSSEDRLIKKNFAAGDCFGVASMFGAGGQYVSSVKAVTDCSVQFITEAELERMFKDYPLTAINYISFLSGRVRFLNTRLGLFTCKDATARLYRFLCDNADENRSVAIKNMSQLAKLTSLGRSSLYRSLDELTEQGHIRREGNCIFVADEV